MIDEHETDLSLLITECALNLVRTKMKEVELNTLASSLLEAKTKEAAAKAVRIAIEVEIAALIPGPEEGQKTVTLPDKRKVIVERGFNYTTDFTALRKLALGKHFPVPIESKTVYKLDEAGYRWYKKNHPDLFGRITTHVEARPKKVSVTVKVPK